MIKLVLHIIKAILGNNEPQTFCGEKFVEIDCDSKYSVCSKCLDELRSSTAKKNS